MTSQPPSNTAPSGQEAAVPVKPRPTRRQRPDYRHIHRFPLPLTVHPLPPLIPHNPLSIVSVLLSYLTYFISPPQNDIHSAYFDTSTSSVHVTDEKTIRALWEMGFFGKGSLSRSEPTWLEQEKKRKGLLGGVTSEEITRQRRAERRELKLQRARSEKLIIEQRLQAEAAAREGRTLPEHESALPSSASGVTNGAAVAAEKFSVKKAREAKFLEAQKLAARDKEANGKGVHFPSEANENASKSSENHISDDHGSLQETTIQNEEHLQLSNEEALFLVYGLGALHILDHDRKTVLSPGSLLSLFCHHSYSPPRELSLPLKTDDPFLVSYVVYHHFRSLGWVIRSGVKFGVDYLLYNRGPVFSHAEFAVVVVPSYDHSYWSETEDRRAEAASKQSHSWWWLHCVNRVQAQVKKTLVVCYVEIPPPCSELGSTQTDSIDIGALLCRYRVREILIHDSIDIARLQRVALGLPRPIENNTLQDLRDPIALPRTNDSTSTSASQGSSGKSRVYGNSTVGRKEHTTGPLSTSPKPPDQTPQPLATKMGSGDTVPSDTQVISQSVYDELIRQNKETGNDGPDSNVMDRGTLLTLDEGDSGHIDLLAGFDGANIEGPNTDENDDQCSSKLGESSPLVYEPNLFPESQRFLAKTPVTATRKNHVEAIAAVSPLASRNPLAPELESGSGIMALSQVFKATQAPSSPLVNGLQSDMMSDRPSPNVPIQHRPLAPNLSSPFNTLAATFPRDSSDTQLNYVSVKESQSNMNTVHKQRMTRSADHIYSDDQSDGEFDKEPSFVERMKRQRRIEQETTAKLATVSAPARRPSRPEMQTGGSALSPSRTVERTDVSGEPQGRNIELQAVGTSEEETEQEEEMPEAASQPRIPNSSTEEDKENCHDPDASFPLTASAHDRLSQVLSLHESPLAGSGEPVQTAATAHPHPEAHEINDMIVGATPSSPITVVKDSQWSPDQNDAEQTGIDGAGERSQFRGYGSQQQNQPASGSKERSLSPPKRAPVQISTQGSQSHNDQFHTAPPAILPCAKSNFTNPARSCDSSREGSPDRQPHIIRFSDSLGPDNMDHGDKPAKSSSMPSRVAETPVHRRQRSSNDLPLATIPETSPNRMPNEAWTGDMNNEAADQEDDDLPPPYPGAFERVNQSQPVVSGSSSPIKHLLNSRILSSPSGRQRRALTEIAADASPQAGGTTFDVNINILSADDQEFTSTVAMSPVPPRKKRRGNNGRNIPASDPIVPVSPRQARHLAPPQEQEQIATIQPPQPFEPLNRCQSAFSGRSRPARRAESFWDTEESPKLRVSSKERAMIFSRSLTRKPMSPKAQKPEPKEPPQVSATPVPQEIPSTPVIEVPSSEPVVEEIPADKDSHPPAEDNLIAPNQVLAPWRGQKRAYYPAACFGKPFGTAQDQYLVKFEDSAPVEVPVGTVKRLEFRIGDAVKVDMPNVPKVTHIIKGFADKLSPDDLSKNATNGMIPVTDVYGYSTLILGPKQRKSLPTGGLAGTDNVTSVPMSRIYLDTILWNQLKDRSFTYNTGSGTSDIRPHTPSDRHITPTSPSTRLSRSFRPANGLFSGMVFAVSYGDKSDTKYRITKMILENDGRILEDGFNELFEVPLNAPPAPPAKSPETPTTGANVNLRLKPGAEEVGFACLIADKHSRRPKYMQALALNLPCLSDRWIEDCVAKGQILDWEIYLLPAGESSYLNGATKSRILAPYLASKARLSETVAARPNLLNGQSVLLITGRHGKADEERRKAYIFLTYALGASKIERVPDVQSARAVLKQSQGAEDAPSWDWVYIDDDDKAGLSSKKRRKSRLIESVSGDDLGLGSNIGIVGNEFVCQSLILGRLVDQ
ncbi:hypothetical protein BJX61DRAFT_532899 [Aspergillus egyptiacus]|nr:hypothetical protein BJX61DRAFT_532899 [Aspergillus egyptiacus]